jgi:hypothetical protein
MKAKRGFIRWDDTFNEWNFKKELERYDSRSEWTEIIYFEVEE